MGRVFRVFWQVRLDPRHKGNDPDAFRSGNIAQLSEEDLKGKEGDYIYCYCYNGGGASQVWLGSGRYVLLILAWIAHAQYDYNGILCRH